jgi:hypothetical protein
MEKAMRKRTDFIADGGFWLLRLARMLSSLYICLGRYGDRMNIGPAPHEGIRVAGSNNHRGYAR